MKKIILSLLFLTNLGAIIGLWAYGSFSYVASGNMGEILIGLGRLCGLLAEFLILVELLLISRIPFIERAFGFDKLNKAHRWIGYGLLISILLHPLLLLFGYANVQGLSLIQQSKDFILHWEDVLNAIIGVGIILFVGTISLPIIRKRMRYESWHIMHLGMYFALVLIFDHQIKTADLRSGAPLYYWLVLNYSVFGLLLLYRFSRPVWLYWRHRFYVEKIVQESYNVWSVYITGRSMEKFTFDSGQYIHVIFWKKGLRQPHPFSLSKGYDGKSLRISVKALGDFTNQISSLTPGTLVFIEGPFGRFTKRVAKAKKCAYIAGGIGITPIRALIEESKQSNTDMILLYGNRTSRDIVFEGELTPLVRILSVLSEGSGQGEHGRIDGEKIKRLIPDILERDVYVCGPPLMMNGVIQVLEQLGLPKQFIHFEKFAY